MAAKIRLQVNGVTRAVAVAPEVPLLYVLRNDLGLKGAKYGCGQEQCGACKILLDGEAVPCCRLPVGQVGGRQITTVEGLSSRKKLDPVQQAFIDESAAQCGYCTAGLVIAVKGLLTQCADPTEEQVRAALHDHLCRCGSHSRVLKAVRRAAGAVRRAT